MYGNVCDHCYQRQGGKGEIRAHGQEQRHQERGQDGPEQLAALKPGAGVSPKPYLVVTDKGTYEVELKAAVRFLDEAGAAVFTCEQSGTNVDEDNFLRVEPACGRLAFTSIPAAQWARVKSVELAITVQEQHN